MRKRPRYRLFILGRSGSDASGVHDWSQASGLVPNTRRRSRHFRYRLVIALVATFLVGAFAGVVAFAVLPTPTPSPIGDPGSWRLVLDDEFQGTQLNRSLWSPGWFGSGITGPLTRADLACLDPAQVKEHHGHLDLIFRIKPAICGGAQRPYTGAIVTTDGRFSFTYGYVEIRARLPQAHGIVYDWPNFWTDGQHWPTDGENDIVEGLRGDVCWHFHSLAGARGRCEQTRLTRGWHTFGADWEPGSVTYYYDGQVVGTITGGITGAPMYLILSIGGNPSVGPIRPATFRVSYVRVWQH